MQLKISESNIGSSVLGTDKSGNFLKIKSYGTYLLIFVPPIVLQKNVQPASK